MKEQEILNKRKRTRRGINYDKRKAMEEEKREGRKKV